MNDQKALSYFSSLSHISRKIILQEKSLIKYLGNKWTEYSYKQQEELLDDLCVPHFIRNDQNPVQAVADDIEDKPHCWPVLKLPSGEKIIVDENDIWTWRDEHSGPFSWKSKSQQDLTFLDLEPENLLKSHGKSQKSFEPADDQTQTSIWPQPHFLINYDSWTQAVLEDYFANCSVDIQTPLNTPSKLIGSCESPSEEINKAFEDSMEDLSPSATPTHAAASENTEHIGRNNPYDDIGLHTDVQVAKDKSNVLKTPSPKKLPHSGTLKKDGKGTKSVADTAHQLLIAGNKDKERNAFTNPAMEAEWSSFVCQSSTDLGNRASSQGSSPQNVEELSSSVKSKSPDLACKMTEPTGMVMDRGGDYSGGESVENTPDHSTQLLNSSAVKLLEEAEKEEVVYIMDDDTGSVSVTSEVMTSSSADILRSGFDFLDNW